MQANKLLSLVFVFDGRSVLLGLKKRGFGQALFATTLHLSATAIQL